MSTSDKGIHSVETSVVRVRFYVYVGPDPNNAKTNIHLIRSMQKENAEEIFLFPSVLQPLRRHSELAKFPAIIGACKTIKARGQYRKIMVTLSDSLATIYFDEDGNARFSDEYLEEVSSDPKPEIPTNIESSKQKPLQSITKDAIIQRFNGTTPNPKTWIGNLEQECLRLDIPVERNCEVLRLFIEGIALDWFNTAWTLHGVSTWDNWKQSFLDHFATRGWSESSYAINFKYLRGSLSEYVIKKLNLLADCDPKLPEFSRILIVIAGIPYEWHSHLDRDKIKTTNDLIMKINQIDRLVSRASKIPNSVTPRSDSTSSRNNRNPNNKPCSYCESIGKPGRFHPESECKTKKYRPGSNPGKSSTPFPKTNESSSTDKNFKFTNNTELENLFNSEINPKN